MISDVDATRTQRETERSEAVRKSAASLLARVHPGTDDEGHTPEAGEPVLAKSKGAMVTDIDGNDYIDYTSADAGMILGRSDERVVVAMTKAAAKGFDLGSPIETEVRLAELVASRFAAIDMVCFAPTTMASLQAAGRLARACTKRTTIVMCDGGAQPEGKTRTVPYNDADAIEAVFDKHGKTIAAVVIEPVATRFGVVLPEQEYLASLRTQCDKHGSLLIFDESATAFRAGPGGAAGLFGIAPDLTLLGPTLGGGLTMAGYGGRRELMKQYAQPPEPGAVRITGHALALSAGVATLQAMAEPGFYESLEAMAARLEEGLRTAAESTGLATQHTRIGSALSLYFTGVTVRDLATARTTDTACYHAFRLAMLDRGVMLPASALASMCVSAVHTEDQIERTIGAAGEAFQLVADTIRP